MELETLSTQAVDIMEQVMQDQGEAMIKAGGRSLFNAAKALFDKAVNRIKKDDPKTAKKYPENPEGYKAPMQDSLKDAMKEDPGFKQEMEALLAEFKKAEQQAGTSYQATVTGSGAVAQNNSIAAGKGGFAVGGNVSGGIHVGAKKE